jgi:hypothetical protein
LAVQQQGLQLTEFEEFRLFHRKDGKVVKEGDDLMSASRYGVIVIGACGARAPQTAGIVRPFVRRIPKNDATI